MFGSLRLIVPALVIALAGCSEEAETRPQLLVVVDTNAPLTGQLEYRPELSRAAAIDTLRIDVEGIQEPTELALPDASDWPVSFGVLPPASGDSVTIELRAFRADLALREDLLEGSALAPRPEAAIHRVVRLGFPRSGVERVRVLLDLECVGVLPSFGDETSCIDGGRLHASFDEGLSEDTGGTRAGTWPGALETPCTSASTEDVVCIPGGYTLLGDPGSANLFDVLVEPLPLRPVVLHPFRIDRTEFTVGRFRSLLDRGFIPPALPKEPDPSSFFLTDCTWSPSATQNDDRPLNCVTKETAMAACQFDNGELTSEARFSHVASGRGLGRTHSWGEDPAVCCRTSIARLAIAGVAGCPTGPVEPVGSHTGENCEGVGDVSRDGVLDLGGSLSELVVDTLVPYDGDCWKHEGPHVDPVCNDPEVVQIGARGGNWASTSVLTRAEIRLEGSVGMPFGFRCTYADTP